MQLKTFLLDLWLEEHEHAARYNLAASTGPSWTVESLLKLMNDDEKERFLKTPLTYCPAAGHASLRREIAAMYGASPDDVLVVAGASEALLSMFYLAAEDGKNVVVQSPAFPPFLDIPEGLGLEIRSFELRFEDGFEVDVNAIKRLVDDNTELILVNSPHNPTGSTTSPEDLRTLSAFARERGVQLVVDEVYHPIYHGTAQPSAGEYLDATVFGDFSKAFSLPGIRIGWILERDEKRREAYWNTRAHFSISNNLPGEILAEVATRNRETIFARTRQVAEANLAVLDELFRTHADLIEWVRPNGGMTIFPRFRVEENARSFCEAACARGVVLAPGDCFGFPAHFRLGFGACDDGFERAVAILSEVLEKWPVRAAVS